ncbi:Gfo/Idh/MocA family oxidoreductase [Cohnella faecalis]|uniref:Gfo/Idh/MocA family oxidoreductase n=1 Tax=Cohnella faecalis TaxID=2315694 RepID=UPI001F2165F7|nr:Gfo/Idh/MocA family oxidoreductase [Cohnella faecalis]
MLRLLGYSIGHAQVEVAAISDDVPQRSELLAASRSIPYFSDYRELLADRTIDAVVICSRTSAMRS